MSEGATPETVQQAMTRAARSLDENGLAYSMRDVRRLMTAALAIKSDRLTLHLRDDLPPEVRIVFDAFCARRGKREPVSRILGGRLFFGRWFKNSSHVLDPRPETEILVERALQGDFDNVLDIGTGSGCIALTLLAEKRDATAIATDVSPDALKTALENAVSLEVSDRVTFVVSDWFHSVDGRFDLIVSNPPYIHPTEMNALSPEVAQCDPHLALTDFVDGLTGYREIAAHARGHLHPGGRVLVEIGPTQAKAVHKLFVNAGLVSIAVHPDFDGRERVVEGFLPDS